MTARSTGPQSRASVACTACRNRRTKCIMESRQTSCNYCRSNGQECIVHALDERKRPKSKVYLTALLENIQTLEERLREAGHEPPKFQHSTQQKVSSRDKESAQDPGSKDDQSSIQCTYRLEDAGPTNFEHERVHGSPALADAALELLKRLPDESKRDSTCRDSVKSHHSVRQRNASEPQQLPTRKSSVWSRIYGPDRFIYDREKGLINYFSPSTCYKSYLKDHVAHESWYLDKRSYRILADIPADLSSYLMDLFWNRYNNTLRVIDQQAFCNDQKSGGSTYYSGFLHLVCLALGFRFADKHRPGMRQVTLNDEYSVFQREAKYIVDRELEDPQGLTIIQAMLVLSDLECACGRDDLAAMHVGTSCRLAFDFGLNLDCSTFGLSQAEMKFRKDLLRSCIIYDQAWALYRGRPTNMKFFDISSSLLTNRSSNIHSSAASNREAITNDSVTLVEDLHGQILDALLELSELSSKIQELAQPRLTQGVIADEDRLIDVAALDIKLKSWYSMLPPRLKWTAENIKHATRLFFLMHQQFHVSQLILHGPYGHYEGAVGVELEKSHVYNRRTSDSGNISAWQHLARSITMNAAMKIVQGFLRYRQKFGICQTSLFSLQQGGTAFLALMCNIKVSKEAVERNLGLQHLYILMEQLREMSQIYDPAKVMCSVVKHEMEQLGIDFNDLPTPPLTPEHPVSQSPMTPPRRANPGCPPDSGPGTKRRCMSADKDNRTATSVPPPDYDLSQNQALPNITSSDQFGAIDLEAPAAPSLNVPEIQFHPGFHGENFGSLGTMPDPMPDLNMHRASSFIDFSEPLVLFDFEGHDQSSNDFPLSFSPPDTHCLDGIDTNWRLQMDAMEHG